MYTLIISLILFCSFLLVVVVLAQNSKGGGLSSQFGGSGASNMFGVKKTGDFLEKSTWALVALIMVLALSTNFTDKSIQRGSNEILDAASEQAPALNLPQSTTEGAGTTETPSDSAK
jgi:preprotein translocase subunit SecG